MQLVGVALRAGACVDLDGEARAEPHGSLVELRRRSCTVGSQERRFRMSAKYVAQLLWSSAAAALVDEARPCRHSCARSGIVLVEWPWAGSHSSSTGPL